MEDQLHKNWIDTVFASKNEFSQNEYVKELKKQADLYDLQIGNTKLRDFAQYHIDKGFVENKGTDKIWKLTQVI
jgi:hypothetical protein